MQSIVDSFRDAFQYITSIGIADIIDILIVAVAIYKLIELVRRTGSMKLARGIVILLMVLWLSGYFKMNVVNFLMERAVELGLLAIVILFQPELRRVLEKMGSSRFPYLVGRDIPIQSIEFAITQAVLACVELGKSRTGALIVFERDNPLGEQMNTGTRINAETTAELLKNIFYPKAPLHDGAVIVREGRISAAGCMLPLSNNTTLSRDLGMRHRAGIGMSERSDAVVIIVSEENGSISVAIDGMLKRHLSQETFEKLLRNELTPSEHEAPASRFSGILTNIFKVKKNGEKNGN